MGGNRSHVFVIVGPGRQRALHREPADVAIPLVHIDTGPGDPAILFRLVQDELDGGPGGKVAVAGGLGFWQAPVVVEGLIEAADSGVQRTGEIVEDLLRREGI